MPPLVLVAFGGALGTLARAAVVEVSGEQPWWGTLAVNVLGCLLIGYLLVVLRGSPHSGIWMPFAVTGFLGGFTTFSALALDTLVLIDDEPSIAVVYLDATLGLGLLAVPVGSTLTGRR
jgi:CrcB protein